MRLLYNTASATRKDDVLAMLVCKDAVTCVVNVYAIKIAGLFALNQAIDTAWDNPKYATLTDNAKIDKIHEKSSSIYRKSNNQIEKSFLQQYATFGISLYKADAALDNWNELTLTGNPLTPDNQTVTPTPCN